MLHPMVPLVGEPKAPGGKWDRMVIPVRDEAIRVQSRARRTGMEQTLVEQAECELGEPILREWIGEGAWMEIPYRRIVEHPDLAAIEILEHVGVDTKITWEETIYDGDEKWLA